MPRSSEVAEELCLEAEAWATELEEWVAQRPTTPDKADITSLASMLRAIAKSIQLSIIADESAEDREYLLEELESAIRMARTVGSKPAKSGGARPTPLRPPAAAQQTMPPPPGMSAAEILARVPNSDLPASPRRAKR